MTNKIVINGDNGSNSLSGTEAAEILYGFTAHSQDASLLATKIASYGDRDKPRGALPLALTSPPDDPDHLFVVQQKGVVSVLNVTTGKMLESPYMDLSSEIPIDGEQGMLGFAFDPNYEENRFIYVYISTQPNDVEIRRYTTAANNPHEVDPSSKHVVKKIDFPDGNTRHRSGWIDFGPDGYLYVSVGDAGSGANAQKIDNPFGKILRLDVHGDDFPADPNNNYAVPSDNPRTIAGIAGDATGTGIYAAGLRNPWKGSFDRATGELYISDVAESGSEEVNLIQAGANYGWSRTEGTFDPAQYPHFTNPIHAFGRTSGGGVVGGYVYRGQDDAFHGQYFFGDFGKSKVWSMDVYGEQRAVTERTADIKKGYAAFSNPGVFGEDALGNLYVATFGRDIIKLTAQTTSLDEADVIDAGGGNDVVYAGAGDDKVFGGTGNDTLSGMNGNDSIDGGSGRDRMLGGRGNDIYVVDDAKDKVVERTGEGKDTIKTKVSYTLTDAMSVEVLWTTNTSGTASINLTGNKLDNQISGNAGTNVLSGMGGADIIRGLGGDDVINGGAGNDDLHGDAGNDRLDGGTEDDKLEGGAGTDHLTGGAGGDTFVWLSTAETSLNLAEADIVLDFKETEGDRLSLLNIDAREDRDGAQAFSFIGTEQFTRAGQVRYETVGGVTLVYLNTDADLEAEGVIRLAGVHTLSAENFIL
ncbi:PQQ-dependent sugar dehydrogenase [Microvirga guangxiensis]|uniref:Glucose/arabinose dehydrogenase, beta-propeller fold n=1 Tax=Microvirga guangxiensis TaxID=549386 RepID=A0A1G5G924_9HYPH|nr:PQQ-dependent sugar dehydrogenase [Microvirga guangxiensis]SCY47974.1 Glucose/arabinose dehydrogenase, beta-propeller fold [Microvirga guangxiensis]